MCSSDLRLQDQIEEHDEKDQYGLISLYRAGQKGQLLLRDDLICIKPQGRADAVVVVPSKATYDLIYDAHEREHAGILPTCATLERDFYIHRMQEEVSLYIANCEYCQSGKRMPKKFQNKYGQVARPEQKLAYWSMDL